MAFDPGLCPAIAGGLVRLCWVGLRRYSVLSGAALGATVYFCCKITQPHGNLRKILGQHLGELANAFHIKR